MLPRLFKHSTWLLLARLWTHAGMALFTVVVARQFGGSGFGEYAFMASLMVIGNMLTTFGTDMHLIREIAAREHTRDIPAALAWQVLLSLVLVTAILLTAPHLAFLSAGGVAALRIYSFSLFPLAFFTVFTTALRGKQQMEAYAWLGIALASLQILAVVILVLTTGGLVALAGLLLLMQVLAALLGAVLCSRTIPGFWSGWRLSLRSLQSLVSASAPMAVLSALSVLYARLAPALLPFLAGAFQAGVFSAAARLVEFAKAGQVAVFTALYPMMAESKGQSRDWFTSFRPSWLFLLGAALLASVGVFVFAETLVGLLLGEEYSGSVPVVRVLAWIILPYTMNTFMTLAFLANGDELVVRNALVASLALLVILVAWWGGTAGSVGVAWAAFHAENLHAVILLYQASRRLHPAFLPGEPGNELSSEEKELRV